MSINFSGIASGLDVSGIIAKLMSIERIPMNTLATRKNNVVAQQSQYQAVASRVSDLKTAMSTLTDARLGSSFDLFEAKKASTSNSAKVTATVTNDATQGSFTLDVTNLATATKAASTADVGAYTTAASTISTVAEGGITSGTFTLYVNSEAVTITVDATVDTVGDIATQIATEISNVTGGAAVGSVTAAGKIQLTYDPGSVVSFGANGDTSNFATLTHLATGSANGGLDTFTAKYGTSTLNKEGTLVGNAVGLQTNTIAAGTLTIGKATFTIDATTTLQDLMADINSSSSAGVLMSINTTTNRIEMVSKSTGKTAITMDDGATGFLASVKLISGADTLTSQTLGNNAKFKINAGVELESTSNTVDPAVSGLTGVTLSLLDTTTSAVTLDIKQDTDQLTTAVTSFVTKFNATIAFIDDQTKKGATLNGENALTRLRNQLRTILSDQQSGLTNYSTMSQVGISTGAINTDPVQGTVSNSFKFSSSDLLSALANDPEEVKHLFIGDGASVDGIMNTLQDVVNSALDPEFGVFSSRDESANNQIKNINDAITRGEARLTVKEQQLRAQFLAMDQLISKFQQQGNALSGLNKSSN